MLWQLYGLLTGWELHKVCFNLHISICEYEELVGVCTPSALLHTAPSGESLTEKPLRHQSLPLLRVACRSLWYLEV